MKNLILGCLIVAGVVMMSLAGCGGAPVEDEHKADEMSPPPAPKAPAEKQLNRRGKPSD